MAQYYIGINNQQLGPFEVNQLLENGLTPETLVWTNGMPGWEMAKNVPELSGLFVAQQPQYGGYQQPQYGQQQYQQQAYQQYDNNQFVGERPQVSFGDAIKICFNKYVDFSGRARRSEYWWFALFTLLLGIFTCGIGFLVCLLPSLAVSVRRLHDTNHSGWWVGAQIIISLLSNILSFVMGGYSAYSYSEPGGGTLAVFGILGLGSLVLWIITLVFYCTDSDRDENQYGPSPKYQ